MKRTLKRPSQRLILPPTLLVHVAMGAFGERLEARLDCSNY